VHEDTSDWKPKWRPMRHVWVDPEKPHVTPGFLLYSIGFGLHSERPKKPPSLMPYAPKQYYLQLKIFQVGAGRGPRDLPKSHARTQAANLPPAADGSGSANPFLVVRFAEQRRTLPKRENTLYPFWYELVEMYATLDRDHAPSLYLLVYHDEGCPAARRAVPTCV
jgi:hypothetical protein